MVMALGLEIGHTHSAEKRGRLTMGERRGERESRDRDRPRKFSNLRQLVCRCEVGWHASR